MVFDDQPCPARSGGLTHVGTPVCECCGQVCASRRGPLGVALTPPQPRRSAGRIPRTFWAEWSALRRGGMTDSDAQSLICNRRGLTAPDPADGAGSVEQRQRAAHGGGASPWNLRHLVYLEGVRWRAERDPDVEAG